MKIAVCEDISEEAEWLCEVIYRWSVENEKAVEITSYADAASFSFALEDILFDVLFLDIRMPGEDGVTLAKRLRKQAYDLSIVFVTGEREYIMEGYEVEAVNYLLKPLEEEKVFQCLNRICEKSRKQEPFIILKTEDITVKLLQREIYLVEVFGHRLVYVTEKGSFEVVSTMKQARQELREEWFVTCHRGVLVNLLYVDFVGKNSLLLSDDRRDFRREVPVSRRMYGEVNQAFIRFYR
jgi:Response regulator of the LytR/AlgR family